MPNQRPSNPAITVLCFLLAIVAGGVLWQVLAPRWQRIADPLPAAQPREIAPKSDFDREEREAIDLFKLARESVVNVDTLVYRRGFFDQKVETLQAGTGSGFIWDDAGHVVTNYHVIRDAVDKRLALRVVLADRTACDVTAVVGVAPDSDLAVLRIAAPREKLKKIAVGRSHDLEVGQKVYALGNPFGLSLTLTKGIISALDRQIDSPGGNPILGAIQTDAPINPGNSGGPLLDKDGRLIGVNTSIASPSGGNVGIGFAVPIDTVNEIVPKLIADGRLLKPDLGIALVDLRRLRRSGFATGVMVERVEAGSPAAAAGLKGLVQDGRGNILPGDRILKFNGADVADNTDFERKLFRIKPGETIRLGIENKEGTKTVELTVRGI
jgi:S1-C subfamily serine protease